VNWLEVSLTVSGELAEAVADVLARFAPNGVTTEQAVDFLNEEDEGTPVGPITVRAYLAADERLEETRQKLEESLHYLGMIQPLPPPVFTPLADKNWMEAWMESPEPSRIAIKIDPGMAFGTGTHPTTQLCLQLLESHPPKGEHIIDVGCGSGILSIAGLKLGADFALGVDIDEASVKASRQNANANGIPESHFEIGLGSVTEILTGSFQVRDAPLVMANILAPIIIRLFDTGLSTLVSPGGTLILSGILEHQAEGVISSARASGLKLVEKIQVEDWVALMVQ
jgi:ribosomal protein L11 methyltransferase